MTNTGIIRQLDKLGRITLPMELRKSLGFSERQALAICIEDNNVILRKYSEPADVFTGSTKDLIEFEGKMVSRESIKKLSELAGLI
ncbi:MAG: AbrB family transcriptional regulator [Lachnospiraceae bacterium]|nr:AbrB family transcriptional regulator [Lachnospiraceae bacterium]